MALDKCERGDAELRHMVESALSTRYALHVERIPYREMDLQHFLMLLRSTDGAPLDSIFGRTLAAGDPNVVELTDGDAYAITHAILFLYDFSFREPGLSDNQKVRLDEIVDALLARYRGEGNADLVAELLSCAACLGTSTSEVDEAWAFLLSAQLEDGRIEGPPDFLPPSEGDLDPQYEQWRQSYHTTLVALLACLVRRATMRARQSPVVRAAPTSEPTETAAVSDALLRAARWAQARTLHREVGPVVAVLRLGELALRTPLLGSEVLEDLHSLIVDDESLPWGADTCLLVQNAFEERDLNAAVLNDAAALVTTAAGEVAASGRLPPHAGLLVTLGKCDVADVYGLPLPDSLVELPTAEELVLYSGGRGGILRMEGTLQARARAELAVRAVRSNADYRLDELALVTRALASVGGGMARRCARDAVAVLISQQRVDGSFGYLGREAGEEQTRDLLYLTTRTIAALASYVEAERAGFPSTIA